nr:DUF4880 domain-containing protein [Sphingomonas yunnanensis]
MIEEAAAWLAALDAGTASDAAFATWRDADARHAVAFAEVASTWRDLDALRLVAGERDSLPTAAAAPTRPGRRHVLRAAASVAAVMAVGGGLAYRGEARETISTRVGERRSVAAAPSITLDVNTDSEVRWRAGRPFRLWLERGEMAIRLGRGEQAALCVPAGTFRLAPGRYNARLRGESCELAVITGAITDAASGRLGAGEIALLSGDTLGAVVPRAADLPRVTAWQRDTLMLSGESLDYALAEMNRYLPHKIVIGDPALSRLRLGGTFATTSPAEFLRALHASFGIEATTGRGGGIVLTRA